MYDRYWLLTSTTYGNWLPGDRRGFVSGVRDGSGNAKIHNIPGTIYDADLPRIQEFARNAMKGPLILLTMAQAESLRAQFHETARYRNWGLLAIAIMPNHFHIVVGVPGDPDPDRVLSDFKAYGTRKLNAVCGVRYVREQSGALVVWIADGACE